MDIKINKKGGLIIMSKKLVSVVLILTMVLSMGSMAFANKSTVDSHKHSGSDVSMRISYFCTYCGEEAELISIKKVVIGGQTYYERKLKCTSCGQISTVLYPY